MTVPALADVAYALAEPATSAGHLLDLYLPASSPGELRPLVIWSSGSGWLRDDGRVGASEVADFFTKAGYAVAGVSVRSSSQAIFPAQLHDVKAAIRWLRSHATEHRLDPSRFAIMGNSSGGWLTCMAALTGDVEELEGDIGVQDGSSAVQVAVDFYGPIDFLQMDAHMLDGGTAFNSRLELTGGHDDPGSPEALLVGAPIQARPDLVARANPITYVDRNHPPMMILHGQVDPIVPHHQSELLFAALERDGNEATFVSIPDVGHEHPYVRDASRADGYVVRATGAGRGAATSAPTWETIERFIAGAFRR